MSLRPSASRFSSDVALDVLGCGHVGQGVHVDGDRVVPRGHGALADPYGHPLVVDRQLQQLLRAEQEVAREGFGVKGHHVVAQQSAQQRFAQIRGEHPPAVRPRPRNVYEVGEHRVGALASDDASHRIEVVVVEHDQRLAAACPHLLDHGGGEHLVDRQVAVEEGRPRRGVDVRGGRQAVHAVLEEPQQRVGDDAVEVVVRLRVQLDHAHLQRLLVIAAFGDQVGLRLHDDRHRGVGVLPHHLDVLAGGGRADPHRVGQPAGEADQRGDQATTSTLHGAPATLPAEGDGSTVGQDDDG